MSTLKFSDRVQVREGPRLSNAPQTPQSNNISADGSKYNLGRFPQGMQPIATAPENGWFYATETMAKTILRFVIGATSNDSKLTRISTAVRHVT